MTPYTTDTAKTNLQGGIRKMETAMTPAAQVRRNFQLGRPKKSPEIDEPLHPAVVWQRATSALANFRERMRKAKLNPTDASAILVYVRLPDFSKPLMLAIDEIGHEDKAVDVQGNVLKTLSYPDTMALGLVFLQTDHEAGERGKIAYFPYQFMGLSLPAQAVMKRAAVQLMETIAMTEKPED